jgi:SAM-dependent methyltransferase
VPDVAGFDELIRDKWAGRAQAYAETFAGQCAHTVEPMLDALGAGPGTSLLDVGTGAGAVAVAALGRGCEVVAVDPDPDMLTLAAVRAPAATMLRGTLPDLRLDQRFDAIAANFVLNHVGEPLASVRCLAGLLRSGGRVAAAIWPAEPRPLQSLWTEVVEEAGAVRPPAAKLPPDQEFPRTPEGLAGLFEASGLTLERAWVREFVHAVDPGLWWSGPARGVASIGQLFEAQAPEVLAEMRTAYDRLSRRYLGPDGLLHLPGAAVLAVARA